MRIDSTSAQPQRINDLLSQQQTKEVVGQSQREGDVNKTTKTAMMQAPTQNNAQGVGTKVDFFA
jgi:hypothetical protein